MALTRTDIKVPIISTATRDAVVFRDDTLPGYHIEASQCDCLSDDDNPVGYLNDWSICYTGNSHALGTLKVTPEEAETIRQRHLRGEIFLMPVFAYVHSGTMLRAAYTNPFSCSWDSGQSGVVCIPRDKVAPGTTDAQLEETAKTLVRQFADYINGDVHQLMLRKDDDSPDADDTEYVDMRICFASDNLDEAVQALFDTIKEN